MDPKLLNKEPFYKTAFNWVKDQVESLVPEPEPQPVPIASFSTLDDYVSQ